MDFKISFEPVFVKPLEHGKIAHYGWGINIIRIASERYGCAPYERVKEVDAPLLSEGYWLL